MAPPMDGKTIVLAAKNRIDVENPQWWRVAGGLWLLVGLCLAIATIWPGGAVGGPGLPSAVAASTDDADEDETPAAPEARDDPASRDGVAGTEGDDSPTTLASDGSGPAVVADVHPEYALDTLNVIPPGWRDTTAEWRASVIAAGNELPGGGIDVFPDRRLVANYGAPVTTSLGVLGEMSFEQNLDDLLAKAEDYRTSMPAGIDSPQVLPSLEVIVTVATAAPSPENDYSVFIDLDVVREWVDKAGENGVFVILDLQPGRNDFLSQAKELEEFLRLPHVGLALDPEWRLEPDQVHMRQIGSVDAAEINEVVDYLVGIVREERLPQKILVLHQFKEAMLPDRNLVRTPPELAVVVHADGQGPLGTKYGTWDALLDFETPAQQTLWWGWKNFYDEDSPRATPAQVNQVEPLPVLVTYQ